MTQLAEVRSTTNPRSVADVEEWLSRLVMETLQLRRDEIDPHSSFNTYGFDSSALVGFSDALGEWLGRELDPTTLYDYPTIHSLARAVAGSDDAS